MRIISSHTSYIPTSHLISHFALAQSTSKGDFATVDHDAHAAYDHKRDQQQNVLRRPSENQQWLAAFIHPNFQV